MTNVKEKWAVIQDALLSLGLTPAQALRAAVAACLPEPSESHAEYTRSIRVMKPRKIAALLDRMAKRKES